MLPGSGIQGVRCCYGAKNHITGILFTVSSSLIAVTPHSLLIHSWLYISTCIFSVPPPHKNAHHSSSLVINATHYRLLQLSSRRTLNKTWGEEGFKRKDGFASLGKSSAEFKSERKHTVQLALLLSNLHCEVGGKMCLCCNVVIKENSRSVSENAAAVRLFSLMMGWNEGDVSPKFYWLIIRTLHCCQSAKVTSSSDTPGSVPLLNSISCFQLYRYIDMKSMYVHICISINDNAI